MVLAVGLATMVEARATGTLSVLDSAYNPTTGHWYYLLDNSNWTGAENAAITLGGHLATINNGDEQNWVWNRWGSGHNLWLGLNDAAVEGTFAWSSGELVSFTNWRPGEPNNGNGGENYVYMMGAGLSGASQWNDFKDENSTPGQPLFYGVVEVPEPASGMLLAAGALALWLNRRVRNA